MLQLVKHPDLSKLFPSFVQPLGHPPDVWRGVVTSLDQLTGLAQDSVDVGVNCVRAVREGVVVVLQLFGGGEAVPDLNVVGQEHVPEKSDE